MVELPPLQPVPHVARLLAPQEQIIYTAKLHFLHGWPWLLASISFLALAFFIWWGMVFFALPLLIIYSIPFRTNEIAVTTHRLLLRIGRFKLTIEGVTSDRMEEWFVGQTAIQNILRSGDIIIGVKEGKDLRKIYLHQLAHPMSFIEALETLQPQLKNGGPHAAH